MGPGIYQYLPLEKVGDGNVAAFNRAYWAHLNRTGDHEEAVRVGLAAVQWPTAQADGEFWVVEDRHEGTSIWRWDGTRLIHYLHRLDIAAHAGPLDDPTGRDRLWELITQGIPTAPPCQHPDGCKDVAITHPDRCPTHIPET